MRTPSRNLGIAITVGGVLLSAVAALLQILLSHAFDDTTESPGDTWAFLSQIVYSLQTAGGFVIAAGVVGLVWWAASDRGLA